MESTKLVKILSHYLTISTPLIFLSVDSKRRTPDLLGATVLMIDTPFVDATVFLVDAVLG